MLDFFYYLITGEGLDDDTDLPSGRPYSVRIKGDWLEITDKETGNTQSLWANNQQQGRQWRVYDNHYYRDGNGNIKKNISWDNKLPWE